MASRLFLTGTPARRFRSPAAIDLELLNIQKTLDGTYFVQIRSSSGRGWYSEGDAFETYQLLSIDHVTGCIVVFAEELGRRVEICRPGPTSHHTLVDSQ